MDVGICSRLPAKCLYADCLGLFESPNQRQIVRKGFFYRSSDGRRIPRFFCKKCHRSFSSARSSPCFLQKKRKLNPLVLKLFVSSVPQRRIAKLLKITRRTVIRKAKFLSDQAKQEQKEFLEKTFANPDQALEKIYFDEMESFERSKCLPVSIPLLVTQDRKIIGFRVCSMPAKGPLAEISRKKYGRRKNEKPQAAASLFQEVKPYLSSTPTFISDENPHYPFWIQSQFPQATHKAYKGRRGCVVGQGELKSGGFDPLFAFNHTAAMLRANISRLVRRTWSTTKKKERLADHIAIYVNFHNQILT
jgi:transposase-like protein